MKFYSAYQTSAEFRNGEMNDVLYLNRSLILIIAIIPRVFRRRRNVTQEKQSKSHLAFGRIYIYLHPTYIYIHPTYIYIYDRIYIYVEDGGLLAQLLTYLPTSFVLFISVAFFHDERMIIRILIDF